MKKLIKDNKGVAMVTVLIAITFISIMASSLLYMAYMNYLTKSMRINSTDNFYTDEYALDDLSSSLQQEVINVYKADTSKTGLQVLTTVCGVTEAGGVSRYDCNKLKSYIKYAITDAKIQDIQVDTAITNTAESNFVVDGNLATLKSVKITTITNQGFKNTIITDIAIKFPSSGGGDIDVNDFSVIGNDEFGVWKGNVVMSGNIYVTDGDEDVNAYDTALGIGDGSTSTICTLLSPRGIVDGNIVIKKNASLSICGNLAVNGNVYVDKDAILFVTGTLKINGKVYKGSTAVTSAPDNIIGWDNVTTGAEFDLSLLENVNKGKLSSKLLTDVYVYNSSYPTNNGWKKVTFDEFYDDQKAYAAWYKKETTTKSKLAAGKKYKSCLGVQNTVNEDELIASLILLPDGENSNAGSLVYRDSTILSKRPVGFNNDARCTVLTYMSDEGYEVCKNTTWCYSNDCYFGCSDKASFIDGEFSEEKMQELKNSGYKYFIDPTYPDRVYIADSSGKNYMRFGNFINPDSKTILSNLFNGFLGDSDPTVTQCSYDNWIKE